MKEMNIPFSPPDIGEEEIKEVCEALRSGWITTGPKTKLLEKKLAAYSHTNMMVALNSATAAMELALRVLEVGPGDEVILPAYTYTATCSVICHVNATPVIIDCAKDSFEMDYDLMAAAITEKTKVIIPVDIAGIICDYDRIIRILNDKKALYKPHSKLQKAFDRVIVLADSAHSFGADKSGKKAGTFADFTSFSFHAVKNLTTAEGGAITWNKIHGVEDDWLYQQFQLLSLHGQTKDALSKNKLGAWEYDVISPAYKCNMTDVLAAVGLAQLKRYPDMLIRRHEIIQRYNAAFASLPIDVLDHAGNNHNSSGHLYLVRIRNISVEQRNEIIIKLAEEGVAANVHYKPLPMLSAYKNLGFDITSYPNAYLQYCNEITLPLYSRLSDQEVDYIIDKFATIVKEYICL